MPGSPRRRGMALRTARSRAQLALIGGLVAVGGLGGSAATARATTLARPAAQTSPAAVPAQTSSLAITGFQSESDPLGAIDASASALTTVGVDGVNLQAGGTTVGTPDASARAQLARAHADGLRAELLVGNFSAKINDFSEPLAYGLLGYPARIKRIAADLIATVDAQGWNGISLDLESLKARDGSGLLSLVQALHAGLPAGDTVSVNVMNELSPAQYRAAGYVLPALGQAASRLILMAYDQHGPWEPTPGPVGALAWQKRGLAALMTDVPADRIDLGEAGYGYVWAPHHRAQLSDAAARKLVAGAGAQALWSASAGEWTATLPDHTTVWWADARSFALRVQIAARLHLHGLAVWSLGLSDPITG